MNKKQLALSLIIALSLFSICIIKVVQGTAETTLIVEVYDIDDNRPLSGLTVEVIWSFNTAGIANQSERKMTNAEGIATFSDFGDYEGKVTVIQYATTGGGWPGNRRTIDVKKGMTYTVRFFLEQGWEGDPSRNPLALLFQIGIVSVVAIVILLARRRNVI